ncbi:hypothetical protein AU476_03135 [Cupriavidus sp. UYMSc13B]|nr:hypothetical protein AU476_03135 [Cupriavidus sp. UYMSc13B]
MKQVGYNFIGWSWLQGGQAMFDFASLIACQQGGLGIDIERAERILTHSVAVFADCGTVLLWC